MRSVSDDLRTAPSLLPSPDQVENRRGGFKVVIFNDDVTPYDAVVRILVLATGCDFEEAAIETWEAHHFGQADVHFADEAACQEVARTIRSIGVATEVRKEWDD